MGKNRNEPSHETLPSPDVAESTVSVSQKSNNPGVDVGNVPASGGLVCDVLYHISAVMKLKERYLTDI